MQSDNPTAATYMGIDVDRAHRTAFALGCGITAIAGGLLATNYPFHPFVGLEYVIVMYAGVVLGGNKSVLFNAEYLIQIAGPVRLVLFYDAGQVRDIGDSFGWQEDILQVVPPPQPLLVDPLAFTGFVDPNAPKSTTRSIGRQSAFKTSTGAEIRFFMPVLNVPFRLIFACNPQRGGVLRNNLTPAQKFQFRFAVGSTF